MSFSINHSFKNEEHRSEFIKNKNMSIIVITSDEQNNRLLKELAKKLRAQVLNIKK